MRAPFSMPAPQNIVMTAVTSESYHAAGVLSELDEAAPRVPVPLQTCVGV